MPGRVFVGTDTRFGFQGMEKVDEIASNGNHYTTEFREYDPRIGRWWSIDRIIKPWESGYAAMSNNPILYIDPTGLDPECPDCGFASGKGTEQNPIELPEVTITPDGGGSSGSNNTPAGSVTGAAGGTLGGMTLDFMVRDRVDYRNTYYNPNHDVIKEAWKSGKMTNGEYATARYKLQAETKAMYKSSISKAMGEIPPTGKPLWQQKQLAEGIASGKIPMPANAGTTRGLTTKIATQTSAKIIGRSLVVVSAGMSIYTIATAEDKAKAVTTEASGWAGAWGGAALGASWGAAVGGPFAPITGAIGGLIGGGIGYFTGSEIGGAAYDAIKEE